MSYCTLLPCYRTLSVTSNTFSWTKASVCQTVFYMRISVSNVTLSVPCYCTHARVITFLPVFPWRVTYLIFCCLSNIKITLIVLEAFHPEFLVLRDKKLQIANCSCASSHKETEYKRGRTTYAYLPPGLELL